MKSEMVEGPKGLKPEGLDDFPFASSSRALTPLKLGFLEGFL